MLVGITGHTHGIGLALAEEFASAGHEVIGFSLTNDYDIAKVKDRERIIKESADCDVFVNNVYHATGQLKLLKSFMAEWRNTGKVIINIGSAVVTFEAQMTPFLEEVEKYDPTFNLREYASSKISQLRVTRANHIKPNPIVLHPLIGFAETDMVDWAKEFSKVDPKMIAKVIVDMLQLSSKGVCVNEFMIMPWKTEYDTSRT